MPGAIFAIWEGLRSTGRVASPAEGALSQGGGRPKDQTLPEGSVLAAPRCEMGLVTDPGDSR